MNGWAVLFLTVFFGGITFNLVLVTRLDQNRRREVHDTNRRLEEVATRAAEAARLLASYHVQLAASATQVADNLRAADSRLAARLQKADMTVADKLQVADSVVADKLQASDEQARTVSIAGEPVTVTIEDDPPASQS